MICHILACGEVLGHNKADCGGVGCAAVAVVGVEEVAALGGGALDESKLRVVRGWAGQHTGKQHSDERSAGSKDALALLATALHPLLALLQICTVQTAASHT
jgi:hypothetical protein